MTADGGFGQRRRTVELPRPSTPRPLLPLALSDTDGRCRLATGHWPGSCAERQLSIATNAFTRHTAVFRVHERLKQPVMKPVEAEDMSRTDAKPVT